MPAIPRLERLRQEDGEFEANVDYTTKPCLNNNNNNNNKNPTIVITESKFPLVL